MPLFVFYLTLDVVLLASCFNKKVDPFVSPARDPLPDATDALWGNYHLICSSTPLQLFPRLLCRVEVQGFLVVLVGPDLPRRAWYSDIVRLVAVSRSYLPSCFTVTGFYSIGAEGPGAVQVGSSNYVEDS